VINWINLAVVLVVAAAAVKFASDNAASIPFSVFGVQGKAPVYLLVFAAFLLGFAGGVLAMNFSRRKHKQEIAKLRRENASLREEVQRLRNLPLQDEP